jgi:hypothetical protein
VCGTIGQSRRVDLALKMLGPPGKIWSGTVTVPLLPTFNERKKELGSEPGGTEVGMAHERERARGQALC